jgi:1-acyl-sn-glycerol-3-phosphate acyltransferase
MRARLRGYLVLAYVAVSVPCCVLLSIPAMLLAGNGNFSIWVARELWSRSILWLAGIRVEIAPPAAPPSGPAIYVSNHASLLDVCALLLALPRDDLRFVAKQELFRIPVFGWYLRMARFVPVDRSDHAAAVASLQRAADRVRSGVPLMVFPEGTRSTTQRIRPFKKGAFVLALEAGVPIVPIAVAGSGAITPSRRIEVHPGTIRVQVGAPIDVASFHDRTALLREVRARIIAQHRALGGLGGDLEDAVAPPGQPLHPPPGS